MFPDVIKVNQQNIDNLIKNNVLVYALTILIHFQILTWNLVFITVLLVVIKTIYRIQLIRDVWKFVYLLTGVTTLLVMANVSALVLKTHPYSAMLLMDLEFVWKYVKKDFLEIKAHLALDNAYHNALPHILHKMMINEDVFLDVIQQLLVE